jgi:hypothetical protein
VAGTEGPNTSWASNNVTKSNASICGVGLVSSRRSMDADAIFDRELG